MPPCDGSTHHCPGRYGGVSMPGKVPDITAGGCVTRRHQRWCIKHNDQCEAHNWYFLKNQTCGQCDKEAIRREIEDAKRKKGDEDEDKPKKKRVKKVGKGGKKVDSKTSLRTTSRPSTRSTSKQLRKRLLPLPNEH